MNFQAPPIVSLLKHPSLVAFFDICKKFDIEARLVGGSVRNTLLNIPIDDLDIAIAASPEEVLKIFSPYFKIIPTGIEHGTLTIMSCDVPLQVTSLREDIKAFGRHAQVHFGKDFQKDAMRRDFTFNALYLDAFGKIHDYFNGVDDLKNGIVRFIGDPYLRIEEDHLRLLRYFRFHSYFGKIIEPNSYNACVQNQDLLKKLSRERIRQEFFKILASPKAHEILVIFNQTGILQTLLRDPTFSLYEEHINLLGELEVQKHPFYSLVTLYHDSDHEKLRRAFVLTRLETKNAKRLLQTAPGDIQSISWNKWLYEHHHENIFYELIVDYARCPLLHKNELIQRKEQAQKWIHPKFPITAFDLMSFSIPKEKMGIVIKALKDYWTHRHFLPTKEELLEVLLKESDFNDILGL